MTQSVRKESKRSKTISCTVAEKLMIEQRADEAGTTVSEYVLQAALATEGGAIPRLVLSELEQRLLHETVTALADEFLPAVAGTDPVRPGVAPAIKVLFEARLEDMARLGRDREMQSLLQRVFDEPTAAHLADRVYRRVIESSGRELSDP